jgi:hypothetical protein
MSEAIKLKLPLEPTHRLVRWANAIRGFYGHPIFLVGSQITGAEDPRDVDVICVIPDHEFMLRFGPPDLWHQEGETGMWGHTRWIWSDDCVKKTNHGMRETGLFIDFKVLPESAHEGYHNIHKEFPPYRLDTRPADLTEGISHSQSYKTLPDRELQHLMVENQFIILKQQRKIMSDAQDMQAQLDQILAQQAAEKASLDAIKAGVAVIVNQIPEGGLSAADTAALKAKIKQVLDGQNANTQEASEDAAAVASAQPAAPSTDGGVATGGETDTSAGETVN